MGSCHDGLRTIVGFWWNGNDGLSRELGIGLTGRSARWRSGVDGRKVFRWSVVDDLGVIECRLRNDARLQGKDVREFNDNNQGRNVIEPRFDKAVPGKAALDEYIRPEGPRHRAEFERRLAAGENKIAKVH